MFVICLEVGDLLLWPHKSPDINIIEKIWSDISREINTKNSMPRNAHELRAAVRTA